VIFDNICKFLAETYSTDIATVPAGLVLEESIIKQILRRDIMRESVTYQAILREGRQEGRKQGLVNIVLRLLTHKFGTLPPNIHTKITRLKIARLENLAEAILDFEVFADLELWFIKKYSLPSIKIDIKTQELVLRRSAPQRLIFHWEGSSYVCKVWQ
jgi:predicted transposase YdaD